MVQQIKYGISELKNTVGGRRCFVVKDGSFDFLNIKPFFEGIDGVFFSDFSSNPLYEQVVEGIKEFNKSKCDMIIAVGGGSAIDVAKCIKLYCRSDPDINFLEQEKKIVDIPFLAIPTTAGTGSESTCHAVIYYKGEKQSISHYSIIPDSVILEPSALETLPLYQKKCTMLDALCQGIESYWSVNSTDESMKYAKTSIELIRDNWQGYIEEFSIENAKNIMTAANYAGKAINITATTAPHAMSYKITSLYSIPHGHAVALCLPFVWEYMTGHIDKCIDKRGADHLKSVFESLPIDRREFLDLFKRLDMFYPVSGNRDQDICILAKSVNPVRLKNNPVLLDENVLKMMYERIVR